MATNDLITSAYFTSAMLGGGKTLTPAEGALVPQLITAASRLARKHCRRYFTRLTYDGLYTVDAPSKVFLLRQFPVATVRRAATDPTIVLSVTNSDQATNQRAYISMAATGDTDIADLPVTVTGLNCTRIANAVSVTNEGAGGPLLFSTYATVQALANAINALGHGWKATVTGGSAPGGYGGWPTLDPEGTGTCYFRPIQAAKPCLGANSAGLQMHVQDLDVQLDEEAGIVNLDASLDQDPFNSLRFGSYLSTDLGDVEEYGGFQGVRVIYDAGLTTVYEDVQQAVVEAVFDMLNLLSLDQRIESESDGAYSYASVAADALRSYGLPPSVLGKLSYYVNTRA